MDARTKRDLEAYAEDKITQGTNNTTKRICPYKIVSREEAGDFIPDTVVITKIGAK